MTESSERRRHPRRVGEGLVVLIGGKMFPLIDVSVKGLSFQGTGHKVGDSIQLKIAEMRNLANCVAAELRVIQAGDVITRGEFLARMDLMKYIIAHVADVNGGEPYYFK